MELVTPEIGLIFWTTVVFSLLLVVLKKYAWKPILSAVDERNKSIEEALRAKCNFSMLFHHQKMAIHNRTITSS